MAAACHLELYEVKVTFQYRQCFMAWIFYTYDPTHCDKMELHSWFVKFGWKQDFQAINAVLQTGNCSNVHVSVVYDPK